MEILQPIIMIAQIRSAGESQLKWPGMCNRMFQKLPIYLITINFQRPNVQHKYPNAQYAVRNLAS